MSPEQFKKIIEEVASENISGPASVSRKVSRKVRESQDDFGADLFGSDLGVSKPPYDRDDQSWKGEARMADIPRHNEKHTRNAL